MPVPSIFSKGLDYEEDGSARIVSRGEAQTFANKTAHEVVASGGTADTQDWNNTTYMDIHHTTAAVGGHELQAYLVYDLYAKRKILNIEVDTKVIDNGEGGAADGKLWIHSSLDGTTWTERYLSPGAAAETRRIWNGGDFRARYIRVGVQTNQGSSTGDIKIYQVRIVT